MIKFIDKKIFIFCLLGFFFLSKIAYAISSGANEPIADNELGLTAKDCAKQYCEDKDGMGLWLTLVDECVDSPNPYFINTNKLVYENNVQQMNKISKLVSGLLCAISSLIGLVIGYVINDNKVLIQNREFEIEEI